MTRDAQRTRRLIAASRASLWWERAWAASWRGLTVLGAGLSLALFDVWTELPPGPRIIALSALLITAITFFWMDWRTVFWPSRTAGLRRLEEANGLVHRPLSAAEDALASGQGDALTEALWRKHIAQQITAYGSLEPVWPKPNLPLRDPYAVRGAVFLALVAGFAVAGSDAPQRIAGSFAVESETSVLAPGVALDAWITPPAYTGLAPVILSQSKGTIPLDPNRTISVPVGSKLTLRLDGATSPSVERIPLDGGESTELVPESAASGGSFTAEYEMTASERLRIFASGRKAGDWEITILPDAAPSIAFDGDITATSRKATRVPFKAGDDYGVASAEAQIRLAPEAMEGDDPTAEEGSDVIAMPLPVSGGDGKTLKSSAFDDLTAHPWAGLDVVVQLTATDATGQVGYSAEQRFTLPERVFKDPLAKAIVEQRKELSRGPGAIPKVAMALEAFTLAPEKFNMKGQIYLGLRSAYWRLMQSRNHADVSDVQALLWDIALSLEDGGVTLAAEEVRRLQKELQAALDEGAPDEEIARLTAELRQAMREMMQAMAKSAPESIPLVDGQTVDARDLESMLDKIEELNKLGDKEAAKQLLSDLQNMMEGMDAPPAQPSEKEKKLAEGLNELNKIIREQEQLRDRTFRKDQLAPGEEPSEGDQKQGDLAEKQGDVGDELGGLKEKMGEEGGEAPGNMGDAKSAMEGAEGALRQSQTGDALAYQDEALAKLKSARDGMRQALAAEQKKNGGMRIGRGMGRRGPGRDPAGRPASNGDIEDGSVKVPTERETQRAREILNELRKRSGEVERPQEELNYLDRLLRRF